MGKDGVWDRLSIWTHAYATFLRPSLSSHTTSLSTMEVISLSTFSWPGLIIEVMSLG